MVNIRYNFKSSQYRNKRYAKKKRNHTDFKVRDHVYLRLNPKRSSLRIGTCAKLEPWYYGPFENLESVGLLTYRLSLPPIVRAHDVLDVSLLKKCFHDSNHVIDWTMIQAEPEG
jgi:hypothetical protein